MDTGTVFSGRSVIAEPRTHFSSSVLSSPGLACSGATLGEDSALEIVQSETQHKSSSE